MYTYNITFVVSTEREAELLAYIKNCLLEKLFFSGSPAENPALKRVVETAGEKPDPEHGISLALSASFSSEEKAHIWHDNFLSSSLEDFHNVFGNEAFFFITLLENLPI